VQRRFSNADKSLLHRWGKERQRRSQDPQRCGDACVWKKLCTPQRRRGVQRRSNKGEKLLSRRGSGRWGKEVVATQRVTMMGQGCQRAHGLRSVGGMLQPIQGVRSTQRDREGGGARRTERRVSGRANGRISSALLCYNKSEKSPPRRALGRWSAEDSKPGTPASAQARRSCACSCGHSPRST
jgi:hypothetical protein